MFEPKRDEEQNIFSSELIFLRSREPRPSISAKNGRIEKRGSQLEVPNSQVILKGRSWAKRPNSLHLSRTALSTSLAILYTPGSGEHGPRFLTGGPGAAPGGVASKNGWVYMRVQGGFDLHSLESLCICVCVVTKQPLVSKNGLRERLRVCRGGSRNQLRGLKGRWVCEARRHALPACGSDIPRRLTNLTPCTSRI